jgi:hypothetical protein
VHDRCHTNPCAHVASDLWHELCTWVQWDEMQYLRVWSKWRNASWDKQPRGQISPHGHCPCIYMNDDTRKRHLQWSDCILGFRKIRCHGLYRHSFALGYLKIAFCAEQFWMTDLPWRCAERCIVCGTGITDVQKHMTTERRCCWLGALRVQEVPLSNLDVFIR